MIKTIDAHVGGQVVRLVVDGFPAPRGSTLAAKREWAARHADRLRQLLMLEPRGHQDSSGAAITEPTSPGSHAGVLFLSNDGYPRLSMHGVIAGLTIALQRGLLVVSGDVDHVTLDTPAGTIRATIKRDGSSIDSVAVANVPAFVVRPGVEVMAVGRRVRADVAFGGEFYAIVDGESAGLAIDPSHLPDIRRFGVELIETINTSAVVSHPLDARWSGVAGAIVTGPPRSGRADLQAVTVHASGAIDRSAGGTGMSAVMAVLSAMGLLDGSTPFVQEGIAGATLVGRVIGRTQVSDVDAVLTEIEGAAWIIGEQLVERDERDPAGDGFALW